MTTTPKPRSGRAYRGASAQARRAQRQEKLLEAGTKVIGSVGYRAATVRGICAEAGLTERYFYESFANREALLVAIYRRSTERLALRIAEAVRGRQLDVGEGIERGLSGFFDMIRDEPEMARIVFVEVLGISETVDAEYQMRTRGFVDQVIELARQLLPVKLKRTTEVELIATGLVGVVINITVRWILAGYDVPRDSIVASCRLIFESVYSRLANNET